MQIPGLLETADVVLAATAAKQHLLCHVKQIYVSNSRIPIGTVFSLGCKFDANPRLIRNSRAGPCCFV